MNGKFAVITIAAACALCLALVGCVGGSASSSATNSAVGGSASSAEASSSAASSDEKHASYFVGKWDLYETEDYTHEQVAQTMEAYATDEEIHAKTNEAYGRASDDTIEFGMSFAADGTGEMDIGPEIVSFTWEAANDGAVTFTSFGGMDFALLVPVRDG